MTTTETAKPSPRQADYLRHRDEFHSRHQRFPTLRESAEAMSVSIVSIFRYRDALARRGEIVKGDRSTARSDSRPIDLPPLDESRLAGEVCSSQLDYLRAIHAGLTGNGRSPTFREYAATKGWGTPNYVAEMTRSLKRRGYLEAESFKSRSRRLTPKCFAPEGGAT